MRKAMKVTPWAHGLGFDVGADAEVWKLATGFLANLLTRRCFAASSFVMAHLPSLTGGRYVPGSTPSIKWSRLLSV
jgi:hypothetical protein